MVSSADVKPDRVCDLQIILVICLFCKSRGDRGWLSHGLVVTLSISYSLDGGILWGFTRDMRIAD